MAKLLIFLVLVFLTFGGGYYTYAATGTKQIVKTNTKYVAGPQGPIGLTGSAGPIGPQGSIGLQGVAGPTGLQGPAGPKGDIGATGATGAQGAQGPAGTNGASNAVLIGATAGGDLSGTYPNPTVSSIGGTSISLASGSTGYVLTQQSNGSFAPQALPSTSIATLSGSASAYFGYFNLGTNSTIQVDATNLTYGNFNQNAMAPPIQYTPGQAVMQFSNFGVSNVNTFRDAYDVQVNIIVTNQAGSQFLYVVCFGNTSGGSLSNSVSISAANCSVNHQIGSDLSFNTGNGNLATTAGGIYSVQIDYVGEWD